MSWLNNRPKRYPFIPIVGMRSVMEAIRSEIQTQLIQNVTEVFPKPLIMLVRVLFVYKKGQIQHNTFR